MGKESSIPDVSGPVHIPTIKQVRCPACSKTSMAMNGCALGSFTTEVLVVALVGGALG